MLFGAGRFGDFVGDPLAWVTREWIFWLDETEEQIKAVWSSVPALPGASEWYAYVDGVVDERGATMPHTFDAPTPGTVPALAAVAVAAGVGDENYDPLGGLALANLETLSAWNRHTLRGQFRQENTAIELWEVYMGVDGEPDLTAAPFLTGALPLGTGALTPGHTYKFVTMKRNRHNLLSGNNKSSTIVIDGSGNQVRPPADPIEQLIAQAAAGAARITASYDYLADELAGIQADTWAIWITTDGSEPDPTDPATEVAMKFADGECKLDYTSSTNAHGTTIKALVRTRKAGTPDVDSVNDDSMTVTADANGPAAPAGSGAFFGEVAKNGV